MPRREVEADGVVIFGNGAEYDLLGCGAEGDGVIVHVAHLADD